MKKILSLITLYSFCGFSYLESRVSKDLIIFENNADTNDEITIKLRPGKIKQRFNLIADDFEESFHKIHNEIANSFNLMQKSFENATSQNTQVSPKINLSEVDNKVVIKVNLQQDGTVKSSDITIDKNKSNDKNITGSIKLKDGTLNFKIKKNSINIGLEKSSKKQKEDAGEVFSSLFSTTSYMSKSFEKSVNLKTAKISIKDNTLFIEIDAKQESKSSIDFDSIVDRQPVAEDQIIEDAQK